MKAPYQRQVPDAQGRCPWLDNMTHDEWVAHVRARKAAAAEKAAAERKAWTD
jgi:hypothetical protein